MRHQNAGVFVGLVLTSLSPLALAAANRQKTQGVANRQAAISGHLYAVGGPWGRTG